MRNRVAVMHGVNLGALDRRPAEHYGGLTFSKLEFDIEQFARELELDARFFQTDHEGAFIEELHNAPDYADGLLLNPGAWTHYAWSLRDAVELAGLPAVEVHLSDVKHREPFRAVSVLEDVCVASVSGQGVAGYRIGARAAQGGAVSRADRVAARLADAGLDLLLVTDRINLRYLTGFTGTNGIAVVGAGPAPLPHRQPLRRARPGGARRLRPPARAAGPAHRARGGLARGRAAARVRGPARVGAVARAAARHAPRPDRARRRGRARRGRAGGQGAGGARRDPRRGGADRRGLRLAARAGARRAGPSARSRSPPRSEMRARGASGPSFPSIVAAAENGALPHATPRDVPIPAGTLVTLDLGAVLDGYCSDCTRTWATGELPDDLAALYATVLEAQEAALDAVRAGERGRDVDAVARDLIGAAGHAEHFGHGLGHGVGLDIHEAPRLARGVDERLVAGNVVTVEPGIYVPGRGGARIEDLVVVTERRARGAQRHLEAAHARGVGTPSPQGGAARPPIRSAMELRARIRPHLRRATFAGRLGGACRPRHGRGCAPTPMPQAEEGQGARRSPASRRRTSQSARR